MHDALLFPKDKIVRVALSLENIISIHILVTNYNCSRDILRFDFVRQKGHNSVDVSMVILMVK